MSDVSDQEGADGGNNFLPGDVPDEDVIKILLSTDNHIGYNEKCEVRGNDSLTAFEEVLYHAQKNDADMILLGETVIFHAYNYNVGLQCVFVHEPEFYLIVHQCFMWS